MGKNDRFPNPHNCVKVTQKTRKITLILTHLTDLIFRLFQWAFATAFDVLKYEENLRKIIYSTKYNQTKIHPYTERITPTFK